MTITAQRLLTKLGNKAWSGFNKDDMVWTSEDSDQAKEELNSALRYLINKEDFPFKTSIQTITTSKGNNGFKTPSGQIDKIYNKETLEELYYIGDITTIDTTETGTPQGFYIDYKNPKSTLKLYPIPDDTYSIGVVYNHFEPVIDAEEGTLKFEFENADDYINIPFDDEGKRYNLEWLFADCLVLMTMAQNNKDEQDENYRPTLNEFEERWKLFKKLAKPVKVNPRMVL
jgi:hypothetical protein